MGGDDDDDDDGCGEEALSESPSASVVFSGGGLRLAEKDISPRGTVSSPVTFVATSVSPT